MSRDRLARLAGLLYLILLPTTGFWFTTASTLANSDPATAMAYFQTSRATFELAIVAGAFGFVDFLLLGLVLYWLFGPTRPRAAGLLLALVAASVPLALAAIARHVDVLTLLDAPGRLPALAGEQLQVQVMLAVHGASNLFLLTDIFWGLWLIPLGYLVFRSGFMPRALGVMLMLGSVFYVATFVGTVFDPGYQNTLVGRIVGISCGIPGIAGEAATVVWLLVKGARPKKT